MVRDVPGTGLLMSRRTVINLVFFVFVFLLRCVWAVQNIVRIDAIDKPYTISGRFDAASGVLPNAMRSVAGGASMGPAGYGFGCRIRCAIALPRSAGRAGVRGFGTARTSGSSDRRNATMANTYWSRWRSSEGRLGRPFAE